MSNNNIESGTARAKNRPERVSIIKAKRLTSKARPGYVNRYVNDEPGNIEERLNAGWVIVTDSSKDTSDVHAGDGSSLSTIVEKVVNKSVNAPSKKAVLMELPEKLYQEDLAEQREIGKKIETALDPRLKKIPGADYGEFEKFQK